MARRKLIWARMCPAITTFTNVGTGVGGAVETNDLLQTYRTQAGITRGPVGLTVMRIRLQITWQADPDNGLSSILQQGLYFGIKVADFQDVANQEVSEVISRGPQVDMHADWMAWGRVQPAFSYAGTDAPTAIVGTADVDVRSMRKLDELGQTLMLAVQTTLPDITDTPLVYCSTSVLLALP